MINATNNVPQTVATNANVLFNTNHVTTNSCNSCRGWLNHNVGSGLFTLTKGGIYAITFSGNVASTVAGIVTLAITNAGEAISGGIMTQPGTVVGDSYTLSKTVLVRVPCNSSVVITVKNTSADPITVQDPSLTIERLC